MPRRKRAFKTTQKPSKRTVKLVRTTETLSPAEETFEIEHTSHLAESWRIKVTLYTHLVAATYRQYPQHQRSIVESHIILGILISSIFAKFGSILRLNYYISRACFRLTVSIRYPTVIHTEKNHSAKPLPSSPQLPPFFPQKLET